MEDTEKETNDIKIPMLKRNRKELISFIEKNPSIYIYGTGFHAGNIWFEFKYYIKKNLMGLYKVMIILLIQKFCLGKKSYLLVRCQMGAILYLL